MLDQQVKTHTRTLTKVTPQENGLSFITFEPTDIDFLENGVKVSRTLIQSVTAVWWEQSLA